MPDLVRCRLRLPVVVIVAALVGGCETSSSVATDPSPIKCQLVLTPPSIVDAGGGPGTFTVTTQPECVWDAASAAEWISQVSPATGQGSATVQFQTAPNLGTASRDGDIVVRGERVRVSQRASCRFDLSPSSQRMDTAGGVATVTVTAASDCAWTATTDAPWIALNAPLTGSGSGTVRFSVAQNGSAERSGSVFVAGQRAMITQSGSGSAPPTTPIPPTPPVPPPCTFTIGPATQNIGAVGGGGSPISVATTIGCQWTASSNQSWITITSGAGGTGAGSVGFSVAGNTGGARTGTLTIAGQTASVTQAACPYSLAPTTQSVPATFTPGTPISVTTLSSCQWTVSTSVSWLVVTSNLANTGNGSIVFNIAANPGPSARTGALTVGGQTSTVVQAAPCLVALSPANQTFGSSGGSGTVNVTAPAGCDWTSVSQVSWIAVQSGVTGSGSSRVTYSVEANAGAPRTGAIAIGDQTFIVTQTAAP